MEESDQRDNWKRKYVPPPNLYLQYRLLQLFWGSEGDPSREFIKTRLENAMNTSYLSFNRSLDFAMSKNLIKCDTTEFGKIFIITEKGVRVYLELSKVIRELEISI